MYIYSKLEKNAAKNPNKIALILDDEKISYLELYNKVNKLIFFFKKLKLKKNEKIGLIENNSLEFILILFAASYLELIIVPFNTKNDLKNICKNFKIAKINYLISWFRFIKFFKKELKLKLYFSIGERLKGSIYFNDFENVKNKTFNYQIKKRNSDYLILFSSGSTQEPKPVMIDQKNKLIRCKETSKLYKIKSNDIIPTTCPIDHSLGLRILFLSLLNGGTCVLIDTFTPYLYYKFYKKYNFTFAILVASQINQITKFNKNLKSLDLLKGIVSASSRLTKNLKKRLIINKILIYEMYGASEVGTIASINFKKNKKQIESVGRSYGKINLKILSDTNKICKKYETGEIICKSKMLFNGYLSLYKKELYLYKNNYFRTGDIGYLDDLGFLYYIGRKKNIIKRSGYMIYPEEIETKIQKIKNVIDISIQGKFDDNISNEKIIFFVILNEDKKKQRLNFLSKIYKVLNHFQLPDKIIYLKKFPKTSLGKVSKPALLRLI